MNTNSIDTASPEFRAHLEWEVARAWRREARLGTARQVQRGRRIRAVTIAALCIALGTVSNLASAQVRDGSRRDSLLSAARADLALMTVRQTLARQRLDVTLRQERVGAASSQETAVAQLELHALEGQLAREQLNIAEIQSAAVPPRDDLNAPLISGRDFVRERIQLELAEAQERLVAAEHAQEDIERKSRAGVTSDLAPVEGQLAIARAKDALAMAAERLALRREFLDKATPADELAARLDAEQARQDLLVAQQALGLARLRADAVKRQRAVGAASELDQLRAQVDVQERQQAVSELARRARRGPPQ